jgi:phosphoribosyl 1,2-cyclic phosphodiesterase
MDIRFWGVRGSIAVCGPRFVASGGNTPCVEILHEGHRLVLDGGTGLKVLGDAIGFVPVEATLLFTHVHWDHIQGVPFFVPAYNPKAKLTFMGARRAAGSLRDALASQMSPPRFPVTLDTLTAQMQFLEIDDHPFQRGPFRITPCDLNHPDGVFAYRIEAGGKSVVFATDVEHTDGRVDERVVRLADGADLLIHDAQFTIPEYRGQVGPSRRGWGHSTWNDAVAVGALAGVGRLLLFHHDPSRGDDDVATIEAEARTLYAPASAAREGVLVAL